MQHDYGIWLDDFPDSLTSGQTVLDIGCGGGDDAVDLVSAGLDVVAVDLKPDNIRRASSRVKDASFVVADLRAGLPFRDGVFDLAVASLSLHYFDRATTDRILRDLRRVLVEGATLLTRVNVVGDVASLWGIGIECEPDFFEVEPGIFKRFYTEASLREALDPYFRIDRLFPKETRVFGRGLKRTILARATRRDT